VLTAVPARRHAGGELIGLPVRWTLHVRLPVRLAVQH
jgi:hypothetical protein